MAIRQTPSLIAAARSMVTQHCLHGELGECEWKTTLDALGIHYSQEVGDPKKLGCQEAFNALNDAEKLVKNSRGHEVELMPLIEALDTIGGSFGHNATDEMQWDTAWGYLRDGFDQVAVRSA